MAVFLLKAKLASATRRPPVRASSTTSRAHPRSPPGSRTSRLAGITGGCGGDNYCPTNPVRRDQMAVFLLKTKHGSSHVPPACAGRLRRRPLPLAVRALDRAARRGADHRRLRRQQLLPEQPEHSRPDGGVHQSRRSCSSSRPVHDDDVATRLQTKGELMLGRLATAAILACSPGLFPPPRSRSRTRTTPAPARCARRSSTPTPPPAPTPIAFNIVGSGVHTIVARDGAARRSASRSRSTATRSPAPPPNTHDTTQGLDTVLRIEIDGNAIRRRVRSASTSRRRTSTIRGPRDPRLRRRRHPAPELRHEHRDRGQLPRNRPDGNRRALQHRSPKPTSPAPRR